MTSLAALRAPAIFISYLLLNFSLVTLIVRSLYVRARALTSTPVAGPPAPATITKPTPSNGSSNGFRDPAPSFAAVAADGAPTNGASPAIDLHHPPAPPADVPLKDLAKTLHYPSLPALLPVFALLSLLSVAVTWTYMIRLFTTSYSTWTRTHNLENLLHSLHTQKIESVSVPLLETIPLWLADTPLFRTAWEAVIDTPHAWWWSQQIFFATEAWSLFLSIEGHRRRIPHLWAYMVVGQLMAISFASNLFFCAVLLFPRAAPTQTTGNNRKLMPTWLPQVYTTLYAVVATAAYLTPSSAHTEQFMLFLLVPHVLLFIPVLLHPKAAEAECAETSAYWGQLFGFLGVCAVARHIAAWREVVGLLGGNSLGLEGLWWALWGSEAVTSVGMDVVLCGLSVGTWVWGRRLGWKLPVKGRVGAWERYKGAGNGVVGWAGMALVSVGVVAAGYASEVETAEYPSEVEKVEFVAEESFLKEKTVEEKVAEVLA